MDQFFAWESQKTGNRFLWNIHKAFTLAITDEAGSVSLSDCGITLESHREIASDVDEVYAMQTNCNFAVLFTPDPEGSGEYILIDGNHRTRKALLTGRDVIPAYLLTPEQSTASLVRGDPATAALLVLAGRYLCEA